MKLYLSSIGVLNNKALMELLPKSNKLSVAVIPNAWDCYPEERRIPEIENCIASVAMTDFSPPVKQ